MGVRVASGTIVIRIDDLELPDEENESQAESALTQAAESAISGGCETYRNALTVESVNLDSVEQMAKWAEVRLTATAKVYVRYEPDDGAQADDWASDYGWNFLAFEAEDVDFDYDIRDPDAGEPGSGEQTWDSEESADDPRDALRMQQRVEQDRRNQAETRAIRFKDILDRVVVHGDTWMDGYLDIDLAHDRANVEDHG